MIRLLAGGHASELRSGVSTVSGRASLADFPTSGAARKAQQAVGPASGYLLELLARFSSSFALSADMLRNAHHFGSNYEREGSAGCRSRAALAYTHSIVSDDKKLVEAVSIVVKYHINTGNLGFRFHGWQSRIDDSGVREVLAKNELAEVTVLSDQCPPLLLGDSEDLLVWQGWGIVNGRGCYIVAKLLQT